MHSTTRLAASLVAVCVAFSTASAAPERRTAAAEYVSTDTRQVANLVADAARRCWLRDPAFAGFAFDKIEQGAEATTFRVVFRDKGRKGAAGRSLRILTGKSGSLVMLVVEQEGVDVLASVRRDATALVRGQPASC